MPHQAGYTDPNDLPRLAAFCETWLCADDDPNCDFNAEYDSNDDGFIDLTDFVHLAAGWHSSRMILEKRWYYLRDALGSVTAVTGSHTGAESEFYLYDAYGVSDESSAAGNPLRFAGMFYDAETNNYYVINRYYDPAPGRFFTIDPLGVVPNAFLKNERFAPRNQYHDGMNLYEYVQSNPINRVDPYGLNIYLITGNNSWNPVNNALHQKVCADYWNTYRQSDGTMKYVPEGKVCFSFAATRVGITPPKKTWLGWKSLVLGGCLRGQIYMDSYTGGTITMMKKTTPQQDINWLNYMLTERVGLEDVYSVARHNCRKYSQMEFADAP